MAMSYETRRRVIMAVVALIVVAFVLSTAACTSSTDQDGVATDDGVPLDSTFYVGEMDSICAATDTAIADLPERPAEISDADWAAAVGELFAAEGAAFDALMPAEERRADHRSLTETTELLAAEWEALSELLSSAEPATDALSERTAEVGALTLGRNDLAAEMGLMRCAERTAVS